jgi:hypothetical protein
MRPVFVSFYTPAYTGEAAGLVASLELFGLPHDVALVPPLGNWTANCGHKPSFLLSMAEKWPGRPLVWLDADARVRQYPALFDSLDADFACHFKDGRELLSGTLYFAPTAPAAELLRRWEERCRTAPGEWDQRNLQAVVAEGVPGLRVAELPPQYVQIFDLMAHHGEPVILHRQASRKLKT